MRYLEGDEDFGTAIVFQAAVLKSVHDDGIGGCARGRDGVWAERLMLADQPSLLCLL